MSFPICESTGLTGPKIRTASDNFWQVLRPLDHDCHVVHRPATASSGGVARFDGQVWTWPNYGTMLGTDKVDIPWLRNLHPLIIPLVLVKVLLSLLLRGSYMSYMSHSNFIPISASTSHNIPYISQFSWSYSHRSILGWGCVWQTPNRRTSWTSEIIRDLHGTGDTTPVRRLRLETHHGEHSALSAGLYTW